MKTQKAEKSQTTLKKSKVGELTLPDFKAYYKTQ